MLGEKRTFTYQEVAKHNRDDDCWVVIGDKVLDLTEFMSAGGHSGGWAPLSMAGRDATVAFAMIHPTGAWKWLDDEGFLNKYLVGKVENPKFKGGLEDPKLARYVDLKRRTEAHVEGELGWKQRDNVTDHVKPWLMAAIFVGVYVVFVHLGSIVFAAFTGFISFPLVGVHIHSAAHGGTTKNPTLTKLYANAFSLVHGISPWVWRNKHTLHHIYTMEQEDDDILDKGPITMNPCEERKWYHRFQHLYFWFVYPFLHLSYMFGHAVKLLTAPNYAWSERVAFFVVLPMFLCLFLWIPVRKHGWGKGMGMFMAYSFAVSLAMALVVVSGHMVPSSKYWNSEKIDDILLQQVYSTNNFCSMRQGAVHRWWNGFWEGLNNQLEHHLFPSWSPQTYPEVRKVVQKYLKDGGFDYFDMSGGWSCGLVDAILKHQDHLKDLGRGKIGCPVTRV